MFKYKSHQETSLSYIVENAIREVLNLITSSTVREIAPEGIATVGLHNLTLTQLMESD
jgi:hypothetical protein